MAKKKAANILISQGGAFMTKCRLTGLLTGLVLLLNASQASAELFNATYELTGGIDPDVVSFMFDGTIQGDMDTVVVNSVLMTPTFNGVPPAGIDFDSVFQSASNAIAGVGVGDPGATDALLSFSGDTMDFVYAFQGSDNNLFGFGLFSGALSTRFLATGAFSDTLSDFEPVQWNLSLKPIPEPTSLSLLGLSIAGLGWARRKRA